MEVLLVDNEVIKTGRCDLKKFANSAPLIGYSVGPPFERAAVRKRDQSHFGKINFIVVNAIRCS
jgi:hypothetical protein